MWLTFIIWSLVAASSFGTQAITGISSSETHRQQQLIKAFPLSFDQVLLEFIKSKHRFKKDVVNYYSDDLQTNINQYEKPKQQMYRKLHNLENLYTSYIVSFKKPQCNSVFERRLNPLKCYRKYTSPVTAVNKRVQPNYSSTAGSAINLPAEAFYQFDLKTANGMKREHSQHSSQLNSETSKDIPSDIQFKDEDENMLSEDDKVNLPLTSNTDLEELKDKDKTVLPEINREVPMEPEKKSINWSTYFGYDRKKKADNRDSHLEWLPEQEKNVYNKYSILRVEDPRNSEDYSAK